MQKIIVILFLVTIACTTAAQVIIRKDSLCPLKIPVSLVPDYVNFDVVKLMYGHGFSPDEHSSKGFAGSFDAQILFPYALLKENKLFHIAWGISFGRDAIKIKNAEYVFADNELVAITEDPNIGRTVQKVGYFGFVVLPFFEFGNLHVMTGVSARINTVTKLKTYFGNNKIILYNANQLNPVTVPLLLQISYSPRQLFSWGVHGSYDLIPRFKGSEFKNVRQVVVGVSVGLRI